MSKMEKLYKQIKLNFGSLNKFIMKKYIVTMFLLLSTVIIYGQKKQINLKKYALNSCIFSNYSRIDSTFRIKFKDASASKFSVEGNFNEDNELTDKVVEFTLAKTATYYLSQNNLHFDLDENRNSILCDCLRFYESKELDKFIKKILN